MATREANVAMKVDGADQSRAAFDSIRAAAESLGDEGKQAAQKLSDSLTGTANVFDRLNQKITSTGQVTERDIGKAVRQLEVLKNNTIAAFGSLSSAPKAAQDAIAAFEAKLTSASSAAGKLDNAVKDNSANVKAAAGQYTGLGNALESMGGKTGATIAKIGLVAAAAKEGWEIGKKIAEFFGTDFQMWDELVATFGSRAQAVVKALGANITALFSSMGSAWEQLKQGHFKAALASFDQLAEVNAESMKRIAHALSDNNQQWNQYAKTIGITTEQMRAQEEQTKKLTDAKKELDKQVAATTKSMGKLTEEITKQKLATMDAEHVIINRTADMDYFAREVKKATAAVNDQRAAVDAEATAHGDNDPMTLQAIERQKQLEQSLKTANERYGEAHDDVEKYKKKQAEATKAIDDAKIKLKELTDELKKQQDAIDSNALERLADATKSLASASADARTHAMKVADALKEQAQHGPAAAIALRAAAESTQAVATATQAVATAVKDGDALKSLKDLENALAGVRDRLNEIKNGTPGAVSAIKSLGDAAAAAAGAGAAATGGGTVH